MPLINGMFFINLLCSVFKDKDHEKSPPVSNLILATQWS